MIITITCFVSSVQADSVFARKRLAQIGSDDSSALGIGDHVYVCRKNALTGQEVCRSRTGGIAGGAKVASTVITPNGHLGCVYANGAPLGACHVNNDTTFFFSPSRNGSCHQESNHMLRVSAKNASGQPILAGPKVNAEVRGGSVTLSLFGNYGRLGLGNNCLRVCP